MLFMVNFWYLIVALFTSIVFYGYFHLTINNKFKGEEASQVKIIMFTPSIVNM